MPQYNQRVFIRGRQEDGSQKKAAWWQKQRVRTGERLRAVLLAWRWKERPPAEECWPPLEAGRGKETILPQSLGREPTLSTLDSGPQTISDWPPVSASAFCHSSTNKLAQSLKERNFSRDVPLSLSRCFWVPMC